MNRGVCLIERGQQRRGRGFLSDRDYRLVYGERGATQFIHHDGCSDFGCVIFAASAAGLWPCNRTGGAALSECPHQNRCGGVQRLWWGPASAREGISGQASRMLGSSPSLVSNANGD